MNTTFNIPCSNSEVPINLIVEIGNCNVAIFCYTNFPFTAQGFYYYTITENETPNDIATALKNIFVTEDFNTTNTDKVHIFYNYAETTLLPTTYFNAAEVNNIAQLMFGNKTASSNLHETLAINNIENIYTVPTAIKNTLNNIFPAANNMHSLSKAIQNTNGIKLTTTIYDKEIRVILYKENAFTIATYFDYTTPEDVCYHLLNVCERFAVNPNDVELTVNGMIDANSNLYREIHKFFLQMEIENLPEKVELAAGFNGIASHYFSPLVKLAKCVS